MGEAVFLSEKGEAVIEREIKEQQREERATPGLRGWGALLAALFYIATAYGVLRTC